MRGERPNDHGMHGQEHPLPPPRNRARRHKVVNPRDMWLGSPALAFRQRHEGGDEQISRQMRRHFDFRLSPEEERLLGKEGGAAGEEALRAYLLLSQVTGHANPPRFVLFEFCFLTSIAPHRSVG